METKPPISSCASWVEPPTCGVRMTLSRPRSGDSKVSPWAFGSIGKTSIAAPAMWPDRMFSRSASSSMTIPREALMKIERGFIFANCSAPNSPAFPGRPSTWRVTTSASASSSSSVLDLAGVAVGQAVRGVVEDHPEPDRLGHVRQLGADVAVADDAERPAAELVAAAGRLVPDAVVHPLGLLDQPAGQRDDLAEHQLDDAAGVGERRVEDGDAALGRAGQVDLVGADAEAPDRQEVLPGVEHLGGDLGVGADPEQGHARQGVGELVAGERPGPLLDLEPGAAERVRGGRMDALQQ